VLSLFNLPFRIQEEREERYKRKKGDSGVYPDLDLPLTRRSSNSDEHTPHVSLYKPIGNLKPFLYIVFAVFDDDPAVPNTTNLYIGCINPKVRRDHVILSTDRSHGFALTDCITVAMWHSCNYTGVLYLCTKLSLSLDDRRDAL